MSRFIRSLAAPVALSAMLVAGACSGGGENGMANDTLAQDTSLNRDLALANRDTAAQPQLEDVPPAEPTRRASEGTVTPPRSRTPAPSKPRTPKPPAPKPPAEKPAPAPTKTPTGNTVERGTKGSEGAVAAIAAGTTIDMTSNEKVCTNTNRPGDRFTATVTKPVMGSNGAVIPAGAKVLLQVSSLDRSDNATDPVKMGFAVQSVTFNGKTYPIEGKITDVEVNKVRNSSTGNDAKKVIGGAVAGAILGQILGHDTKSTVIGAATGAAAGTAVAMGTANYEGCIENGGKIQIALTAPATVQTE